MTLSFKVVLIGALLAIVMGATNVYLGLKVGMTVSASIPSAVLALVVLRILRQENKHATNLIQTASSAGESLAAGFIFTIPALLILGIRSDVSYWESVCLLALGGSLGVVFSVPLRKQFVVKENLGFPEGRATAKIIQNSSGSSALPLLAGAALGAVSKVFSSFLNLIHETLEFVFVAFGKTFYLGSSISPALLGIGFIVGPAVAIAMTLGGFVTWGVLIPLESGSNLSVSDFYSIWSSELRHVGVGAMLVGGLWTLFIRKEALLTGILEALKARSDERSGLLNVVVFASVFLGSSCLVYAQTNNLGLSLVSLVLIIIFTYVFSLVSGYLSGLVGSSNNPVSGLTIATVFFSGLLFYAFSLSFLEAAVLIVFIAAFVCSAAAIAGDTLQDLKAGEMLQTDPRAQQSMQLVGVVASAFILPSILNFLSASHKIGSRDLVAPQASLIASMISAVFENKMPWRFIIIGAGLTAFVIFLDSVLKKRGYSLPAMAFAVGLYLPLSLSVPIMMGAFLRLLSQKTSSGVLFSSGLITGEAILGLVLVAFMGFERSPNLIFSLVFFALLLVCLRVSSRYQTWQNSA